MLTNQLVSICIPTYNNGRYIVKTLQSIINQTYSNLDIIVSDNASTDNTQEAVNALKDKRIRYFRNATNIGSGKNSNKAVQLAKGEFIAVYHSDDIYDLCIVEKELDFLLSYPEAGAVSALDMLIDENDRVIASGSNLPLELNNKNMYDFFEIFQVMFMKMGSFFVYPTFMCKKEVANRIELFDIAGKYGSAGGAGDTAMWLNIAREYKIGIVKERLIKRRISLTQDSSSYEAKRIVRANHFAVLEDFLNIAGNIEPSIMRQYEFNKFFDDLMITKNLLKMNKIREAKALLGSNLRWKNISYGFSSLKNFCVVMIFLIFILTVNIGYYSVGISLFKLMHKFKPNVPL